MEAPAIAEGRNAGNDSSNPLASSATARLKVMDKPFPSGVAGCIPAALRICGGQKAKPSKKEDTLSMPPPTSQKPTRRKFMKTIGAFSLAPALADLSANPLDAKEIRASRRVTPVTDVFMDLANVRKWDRSNGDTWDPFWANDGSLYAFNCDGRGFGIKPRNLAFNQLRGQRLETLEGEMVNTMDEYGKANQEASDHATWKACGQGCIDSVFYAFVSRNVYGNESGDPLMRQTAFNSSLIKSTDGGMTWTRSAEENYRNPMWPGRRFGAPFFVHYGENGGQVTQDGAERYAYAISTNGFWNDGDDYIIGRVERRKLPDLNPADWTYYTGGNGEHPRTWSPQIAKAVPILSRPGECGQTPPCYVHPLGIYLMTLWYNTPKLGKWFKPKEMIYKFYQARHPWGPWSFISSHSDRFIRGGHMYGPSLCARFQERDGTEAKMSLFTSGCPFEDVPSSLYKIWEIPLILRTTPLPPAVTISDDDPRIAYHGEWQNSRHLGFYDYNEDVHFTNSTGAFLELTFTGTGIEYFAEKDHNLGNADVYLDGNFQRNVDLCLENFPRFSQVVVFRMHGLKPGRHTITIVNRNRAGIVVDAFRIYETRKEI